MKKQNWSIGDVPEACSPLGNQTAAQHGLPAIRVVRARTAKQAIKIFTKRINKMSVKIMNNNI